MIIFTKYSTIMTVIVGMVITIVLNKYYYGSAVLLYALMMGLQTVFKQELSGFKVTEYTHIPAYISLGTILVTSFFVLYKSVTIDVYQKLFTVGQLVLSILMVILLKFGKNKFEILNETFINYVPTLLFMGFMVSVGIIKDNQAIINKQYTESLSTIKKMRFKKY